MEVRGGETYGIPTSSSSSSSSDELWLSSSSIMENACRRAAGDGAADRSIGIGPIIGVPMDERLPLCTRVAGYETDGSGIWATGSGACTRGEVAERSRSSSDGSGMATGSSSSSASSSNCDSGIGDGAWMFSYDRRLRCFRLPNIGSFISVLIKPPTKRFLGPLGRVIFGIS